MAVKFISVAYVILQVTKIEASREKKRQQGQRTHTKMSDVRFRNYKER